MDKLTMSALDISVLGHFYGGKHLLQHSLEGHGVTAEAVTWEEGAGAGQVAIAVFHLVVVVLATKGDHKATEG